MKLTKKKTRTEIKSVRFTREDMETIDLVVKMNEYKSASDYIYQCAINQAKKELKEIEKGKS